ncbi:MAG: dTMP kinase [Bacteroidota bacterium]
MLISFEGIDGCGKSTQIVKLKDYLTQKGYDVHVFREPGGTPLSEQIRDILLNSPEEIDPVAELLLFSAARAQLVAERIRPLLKTGAIVILDRFFDSTTAYQGYGREALPIPAIEHLNAIATSNLKPDLTIYLRISPKEAYQRRKNHREEDRMERAGKSFFRRVSQGFDQVAAREERVVVLDSHVAAEDTFRSILAHLQQKLPRL